MKIILLLCSVLCSAWTVNSVRSGDRSPSDAYTSCPCASARLFLAANGKKVNKKKGKRGK